MPAESEHTAPSEWCPRPDRWRARDGWATEAEVGELLRALVRATKPAIAVETGTYLGDTTELLGQAIRENRVGHLIGFETDPDRAARARFRVAGLPVTVLQERVLDWWLDVPVDFAFIDSDPGVRAAEVEHLWPLLSDGAIVAVHDTAPHHEPDLPGLTRGMPALNLRTPRGVLIYQVRKE